MKTKFTALLIFASTSLLIAQNFKPQEIIIEDLFGPTNLEIANLNNNDKVDIVTSSSNKIKIYFDYDEGEVSEELDIALAERVFDLKVIDIDNDSDMDIICGSYFSEDFVYLIENINGQLSDPISINTTINGPISNSIVDFDNDGLLDIVFAARFGNEIVWLKNNGDNNFSNKQTLIQNLNAPSGIRILDFNNDNSLDILVMGSNDGYIRLFLNNGSMNFVLQTELVANFRNFMTVCDINDDGYPDLIADKTNESGAGVSYYENDGDGNFAESKISGSPTNVTFCNCSDVNEDGFNDLIFSDFLNDLLVLYIQDGTSNFENSIELDGQFAKPIISRVIDIDNDNDQDIIVIDEDEDMLSLFENTLISSTTNDFNKDFLNLRLIENKLYINSDETLESVAIWSMQGNLIYHQDQNTCCSVDLSLLNLNTGIYIVTAKSKNRHATKKLFLK